MNLTEIIFIGIALSMDAVAITISNSMVYKNERRKLILMPVFFGIFQGIMPIFGYFLGSLISDFINKYAGIISLAILGIIGGKMVYDGIRDYKNTPDKQKIKKFGIMNLLLQAVATSIDAFAIGVSLCASGVNIFSSSATIALTTFICSLLALLIGKKFGKLLGNKAEIFGGFILLIIGIKAFLQ